MVIRSVDHRDADRFTGEFLGRLESAESSADNHDTRFLCRHIFHATILQQHDWMKAPNSKLQYPNKETWSVFPFGIREVEFLWSLVVGIWNFAARLSWERKQKEFVIASAATIFRASCRSQFPAAKLAKELRSDSKSPLAG